MRFKELTIENGQFTINKRLRMVVIQSGAKNLEVLVEVGGDCGI